MRIVRKNLPLLSKAQYPRKLHFWLLLILLPILIYILSIKHVTYTWQAEDVKALQSKQFKHLIAKLEGRLQKNESSKVQWGRQGCVRDETLQAAALADSTQFSMMINTYNDSEAVTTLVDHYYQVPSLAVFYIVWHDPSSTPPTSMVNAGKGSKPVNIVPQCIDSLNNRFALVPHLQTELVLSIDDDTYLEDIHDVEFAFQVAKREPFQLSGFYPRSHKITEKKELIYDLSYISDQSNPQHLQYSMILTKAIFIHRIYLYAYTCLLPQKLHDYVTTMRNCEDLALNWMVSGMTGKGPLAIQPIGRLLDAGGLPSSQNRISLQSNHLEQRSVCLNDFKKLLWEISTLEYSDYKAVRFQAIPFELISRNQMLSMSSV